MTQQGPDSAEPVPDDSWSSSLTSSSLGDSSLDDAREAAARDHGGTPNPFSREAAPDEALGADVVPPVPPTPATSAPDAVSPPADVPSAQSWPAYPADPPAENVAPAPPYGGGAADPSYGYDRGADGYAGSSGYGSSAQPYGQPPASGSNPPGYGAPAYGNPAPYGSPPAPGQEPPVYGAPAGYPQTPAYGANPYGANPYEVNPYQAAYGSSTPYGLVPQTHPQATVALILGIVGMVLCPVVGIAGLVIGSRSRRQIDAEPQRYTGRGLATAGVVLGVISIVVGVLWVVFLALGFSGAFDT
ncbi:MAG: DUF4190 domain-containing protein [Propionibacteriaceae bacterium]